MMPDDHQRDRYGWIFDLLDCGADLVELLFELGGSLLEFLGGIF